MDLVNFVGHPNRVVALKALRFERVAAEGDGDHGSACNVPLGDLPAVLLCECWNDFRQFAADGPGFDPEWEKKTET